MYSSHVTHLGRVFCLKTWECVMNVWPILNLQSIFSSCLFFLDDEPHGFVVSLMVRSCVIVVSACHCLCQCKETFRRTAALTESKLIGMSVMVSKARDCFA